MQLSPLRLSLREKQLPLMTLLALFIFGYIKGRYTGAVPMRGAVQTLVIGALAAGAAYLIAKWIA